MTACFKLRAAWALAFSLMVPALGSAQTESHRDQWQRVPDVVGLLGAVPGARVADIGAGGGYFTRHLRRAVGAEGRVYAVDIARSAVARLRYTLDQEDGENVDVILGEIDDPRLPYQSLDGALIVNAYHEMTEHRAMLDAIRTALRPGGRLVILDIPPPDSIAARDAQTARHQIAIDFVARDLEAAGFEVVERDPRFVTYAEDDHEHEMWLLLARRPLRDPPVQRLTGAPGGPEGVWACPFDEGSEALAERPSSPDSAEARVGAARIKLCYSRPAMRGRRIMGELVPFGEPWRTGANEPTVLRADRAIAVGGVRLEPGWYSLYTVPEADEWTVTVNRIPEREAMIFDDWVRSQDEGRVTVRAARTSSPIERLTMRVEPGSRDAGWLVIEWEETRVRVPIRVLR